MLINTLPTFELVTNTRPGLASIFGFTCGQGAMAPGTTTFELPDGRRVAIEDWIDDKLYSTISFRGGRR